MDLVSSCVTHFSIFRILFWIISLRRYIISHTVSHRINRGGSEGGAGARSPAKPQVFFANIIVHRHALSYKFTESTIMFHEIRFIRPIISWPNAMACVSKYRRLHSTCTTEPAAIHDILDHFAGSEARGLRFGQKHKRVSGLSNNASLYCMNLFFFLSVSGYFQPHDVTFFGLLGALPPDPNHGSVWNPLGDFRPPDPPASAPPKPKSWIRPCE